MAGNPKKAIDAVKAVKANSGAMKAASQTQRMAKANAAQKVSKEAAKATDTGTKIANNNAFGNNKNRRFTGVLGGGSGFGNRFSSRKNSSPDEEMSEEEIKKAKARKRKQLLDTVKGIILMLVPLKYIIIVVLVVALLILIVALPILIILLSPQDNSISSSSGNVSGVGAYYSNGNTSNITYIDSDGNTNTYDINDFVELVVYNMVGDGASIEIYRAYAILIRTDILSDADGVIKYSGYQLEDINGSSSKSTIQRAVNDTKDELLIDSSNHIIVTGFFNENNTDYSDENQTMLDRIKAIQANGYDYQYIISELYSGSKITNINNYIPADINLELKETEKANELHEPINDFLQSKGSSLEQLNNYIKKSVEPVYGTKEGVATAAVAMINFLYDGYNTKLPYYWNGKYVGEGLSSSIGTYNLSRNGTKEYYYVSFDCSGLAQWAIYNGGFKDPETGTVNYDKKFTDRCSITTSNCVGQIGDLINFYDNVDKQGHVQLIVSVNVEDETYYIAESSSKGVVVKKRAMHKNYAKHGDTYVLRMANFYANNKR